MAETRDHIGRRRRHDDQFSPVGQRNVIDLAFLEGDAWVLVDYKSDHVGKDADKAEATLRSRYQAQLDAYAEAWEQITGQKVSERGLLLTHYDRYVTL